MKTYKKQPADVLDYDTNFADWMPAADSISSKTVTAETGITIVTSSFNVNTHVVKVWLSGGTDGTSYKITVRIVTVGGRTKERDFRVRVKEI